MATGGEKLAGNRDLQAHAEGDSGLDLLGESVLFKQLLNVVDAVATNDCIVLLEGESGTGKELIAKRIHKRSSRSGDPFIPVNCPAVSETLFESQFYGHVKGSFTGASVDTLGMVRAAEGGTLFLDEIGELALHLQPKLLRLLQEKEITPVGGTSAIKANIRFIAATNRSLAKAVVEGKFRRDLYHRLNVVRIQVPPLRRRPEDIELLLDYYLVHYAREYGMEFRGLPPEIRDKLVAYPWPGNVRELCCWIERLYAANLPPVPPTSDIWDDQYFNESPTYVGQEVPQSCAKSTIGVPQDRMGATAPDITSLADAEFDAIKSALSQTGNNRSAAAKLLNIHRTTLLRKLKQYGLG
ncbi:MAG: sigma 54-interacting transcriptional regulator [Phycisphaerae bacterium]|nr:sigma 54-interacting transcriptional regulator [Phycisphaerae bacterium]